MNSAAHSEPLSLLAKLAIVTLFMLANSAIYLYLNHNPSAEPNLLPMLWIDERIEFMAWTVWPYTLLMVANVTLPFLIKSRALLYWTLRAYVVGISLNIFIWIIYPTTYPRPPLPAGNTLSELWYLTLMSADTPNNCLPSGHITIPAVMVWALSRQWPRFAVAAPMWAGFLLLSVTILTTKQHYFWDLPAGLATAVVGVGAATLYDAMRARAGLP